MALPRWLSEILLLLLELGRGLAEIAQEKCGS